MARALLRRALLAAAAVAVSLPLSAVAASAAPGGPGTGGESTGGGYAVEVRITFTGDAAPGGGSVSSVSLPATCWWSPVSFTGHTATRGDFSVDVPALDADATPEEMLAWYEAYAAALGPSSVSAGAYYSLPSREWFEQQIAAGGVRFYTAKCRPGTSLATVGEFTGQVYDGGDFLGQIPVTLNAFPAGAGAPQPLVDPEDLAVAARNAMVIEVPEIDRNPKAPELGAATLVRLPTWFWVTNGEAALGGDGTKEITATVEGTGVWATVTATTGGLSLRSPAGGTSCGAELALTAWGPGAGDGCTVSFSRASTAYPGGYPVQASTQWTATWVGSDATGGALDPLARETVVDVPVAESQAIVTRGR